MLTFEAFTGINNMLPEHRMKGSDLLVARNVDIELTGEITLKPKPDADALQAFLQTLRSQPASDEFVPPRDDAPRADPLAGWSR